MLARSKLLSHVMTPREKLVVGSDGCSLAEANALLAGRHLLVQSQCAPVLTPGIDSKKGKLPIIDADGNLVSLVCLSI